MPSQKDTTKSLPGYDRVLKEALEVDGSIVLDRIASGQRITRFLNPELPVTLERRADLIAMIGRRRVLHVELQATNQADMPYREGIYGFLIGYKYRRLIDQAVLYVGEEPMNMESRLDLGSVTVEYRLIDIREFRAEELMRSSKPADFALAMLASGGPERFDEIVRRAAHLPRASRSRVLAQMTVLSGLRGLAGRLKMELRSMRSVMIDIADNEIIREFMEDAKAEGLKEGREEGREEGRLEGRQEGHSLALEAVLTDLIRGKFGSVPRWASARISAAKPAQLQRWIHNTIRATTVEGVVGRR